MLCCPKPECQSNSISKDGSYYRPSDGQHVRRFRCRPCGKRFSQATSDPAYQQKKRRANHSVKTLLASGVSMRRIAMLLNLHRTTVNRKLIFLGEQAKLKHQKFLDKHPLVNSLQFDDLETIEHTKCKPLSCTLAVEEKTRVILGVEVSQMPAKGLLARVSRSRYGYRKDHRSQGIKVLFDSIKKVVHPEASILSDKNPLYPAAVKRAFPKALYNTVKGARGCGTGQGELKRLVYDPLFSLNHTFAMLRANINRLFRKTWCTTKKKSNLEHHLWIYIHFHNQVLLKS